MSSEVKKQVSELCKLPLKRKMTLEEPSLPKSDLEDNNKVSRYYVYDLFSFENL